MEDHSAHKLYREVGGVSERFLTEVSVSSKSSHFCSHQGGSGEGGDKEILENVLRYVKSPHLEDLRKHDRALAR